MPRSALSSRASGALTTASSSPSAARHHARTNCRRPRRRAIAIIDHTNFPHAVARRCAGLKHVIFLGTGARSYMHPEELAEHRHHRAHHQGLWRHRGGRCTIAPDVGGGARTAPSWTAACGRRVAAHRGHAAHRQDARPARLRRHRGRGGAASRPGIGMRVIAWNRSPKTAPGVTFVDLDTLLARQRRALGAPAADRRDARLLSARAAGALRPGALLVNTARGALVDEAAMIAALRSGRMRHAGARRVRHRAAAGGA